MNDKAIVCACEDVTKGELELAIRHGHADVESMKRYTGLGTGPCQGKSCLVAAMRLCVERARLPPAARVPFRSRPPLSPTSLAEFAGLPDEIVRRRESPFLPPKAAVAAHPLQPREPLPPHARVVIVGGGIMGLALAWNLAGGGETDVLVLERGYLCEGASGRNGGGVRAQWTTPSHIELAKESIDFMARFAQELGINVWLRRGGYLFLAGDEHTLRLLENGARLHRAHGLATRIIGAGEASELVPELDTGKFVGGSWNPDDGVVFPWPFLWGYADGARKRGARVETFTRVTGLTVEAGAVRAVRTDRGTVRADRVVIASGAWSPSVAAMAGVALPNVPYRHEIVSSEPLKPFLGPLVTMTREDFEEALRVTFWGAYNTVEAVLPGMRSRRGGRIVNISSLGGIRPWAEHVHYCASKAGVIMLTRALSKAFAPEITVNSVAPGVIPFEDIDERGQAMIRATRAKRGGTPDEVADAVVYFLKASNFVTGQVLAVDGGLSQR